MHAGCTALNRPAPPGFPGRPTTPSPCIRSIAIGGVLGSPVPRSRFLDVVPVKGAEMHPASMSQASITMVLDTSRGVEGPGAMTLRQPTERQGVNARFDEEVTTMVSKAAASLDAWLTQAEEVLQEQREQSLSPSSTGPWNDANYDSIVTLATFEQGLAELLDQLCNRPGRWVLIANDARRANWFWQALAFEDGSLIVEVVSNRYLESTELQSSADEEKLTQLEWEAPDPVTSPNWRRVEPTTSPATAEVAQQAVQTLREVFRMGDEDRLLLKTFAVADRGDTPASECVPVPESVPESTGVEPSLDRKSTRLKSSHAQISYAVF